MSYYVLFISVLFFNSFSISQVTVNATSGSIGPAYYTTLGAAFTAINSGTHQGDITVSITSNTSEGTTPATINGSGAGSANYSSILIQPAADGVVISGNPAQGFGVIQLNGADNVTINGDNPNTGGINRNLTIANINAATTTYTSVIRIATSSAVTGDDNDTIKNCILNGNVTGGNSSSITSTTGSSNASFGIYIGGNGGSSATGAPLAITSVTTNTAPAGTSVNALLIENNAVIQCARGIVFNGAAASVSNGVTISNNLIGDQNSTLTGTPPFTSPSSTVYTKGIWIAGTTSITISGNSLRNIMSYIGTSITAIELNGSIGAGTINISGNIVNGVVQNAASANAVKGILVSSSGAPYSISGNYISNIQGIMTGTTTTTVTSGIEVSTSAPSGTIDKNRIAAIYNRNAASTASYGINLAGGSNIAVQNNFISDILASMTGGGTFSTSYGTFGIRLNAGSGHKVYHNSINMTGTLFGNASSSLLTGALCISAATITGVDVRNNIFSNTISGGISSIAHVSVYLPAGGTTSMNLLWNNNAYYCGSSPTAQGIAQVGTPAGTGLYLAANFNPGSTTGSSNLRNYTCGLLASNTNNDNSSFATTNLAPFTSAADLHIPAGSVTPLESGGSSGTNVTGDIEGEQRPGPVGSIYGGGYANDIGADEFDGTPAVDIMPPVITYSPMGDIDSSLCRRFTSVMITDALSGVNNLPGTRPRCYFKRQTDANTYAGNTSSDNGWKWVAANASSSPFDFTIDYSMLYGGSGASQGDVIQYFVIAQDLSAVPNVAINSGTPAENPTGVSLTVSDFPISGPINRYSITNAQPVALSLFTGSVLLRSIYLVWQTTYEINNKGFDVERRLVTDPNTNTYSLWSKIAFIEGKGTTTQQQSYSFIDAKMSSGKYEYRLRQIDYNGGSEYYSLLNPETVEVGKPMTADVSQNYPNPSNPNSIIEYQIPFDGKVSIIVYDVTGREIAVLVNDLKRSGFYTAVFEGTNIASGIYFYRIIARGEGHSFTQTKKLILIK